MLFGGGSADRRSSATFDHTGTHWRYGADATGDTRCTFGVNAEKSTATISCIHVSFASSPSPYSLWDGLAALWHALWVPLCVGYCARAVSLPIWKPLGWLLCLL